MAVIKNAAGNAAVPVFVAVSLLGPQRPPFWLCVETGTGALLMRLYVLDNSCAILYEDANNVAGFIVSKMIGKLFRKAGMSERVGRREQVPQLGIFSQCPLILS